MNWLHPLLVLGSVVEMCFGAGNYLLSSLEIAVCCCQFVFAVSAPVDCRGQSVLSR
jgi:hypothetical protein